MLAMNNNHNKSNVMLLMMIIKIMLMILTFNIINDIVNNTNFLRSYSSLFFILSRIFKLYVEKNKNYK